MRSVVLPVCFCFLLEGVGVQEPDMNLVVSFTDADAVPWMIVNDGVMGGRSTSDIRRTERETLLFTGYVSLENNGGFASTRADVYPLDLSDFQGVTLRVRGDGRLYQLRFRTSGAFEGVAYRAEFQTTREEWVEISLPFESFEPSFRGRIPRGVDPLDTSNIRQMGFLIGDKKEGPFRLEIDWVRAYRAPGE